MESRKRSIGKALTWRVVALLITISATWVITGEAEVGLTVGVVDSAIKIAAYYLHERGWNRVGRPAE